MNARDVLNLTWGGPGYSEYAGQAFGSKPSPNERFAQNLAEQNKAEKNKQVGQVNSNLSFYDGRPDESPLYRTMLTSGIESTSRAYSNAKSKALSRAQMAGFGSEQPATMTNQDQWGQAEAQDLAQVPRDALMASADMGMKANDQRLGIMRAHEPLPALQVAMDAEERRKKSKASLWKNIAKIGLSVGAAPFTGGASLAGLGIPTGGSGDG